jgi:hypothetical protein
VRQHPKVALRICATFWTLIFFRTGAPIALSNYLSFPDISSSHLPSRTAPPGAQIVSTTRRRALIPFDELDEHSWGYLTECGIKTHEEYKVTGVLITRSAPGGDQAAFEQILRDPGIYSRF